MGIVVKFSTIADGCWIEDAQANADRTGRERCWRFDSAGRAEWIYLSDLSGPAPRWLGHVYTTKDFTFA